MKQETINKQKQYDKKGMCLRRIPFLYLYKQNSRKDNDRLLQTSSKTRDVINKRPGSTLFQNKDI
ncbi:hypothetical protein ACU52_08320 [Xylanibacter rarus]|uniref:Uncharacterized protein n=1 Tax=Xylanibacter rarus TaxID=1676614 RepID=A0A8E1QX92_9BACT|nr:hypothetical protein ACU52_08320 [Xylanibacter rarus]